jgi:uncharacterized membrane protein
METSVETRLSGLEDRVKTLEGLLGVQGALPAPTLRPFPAAPPRAERPTPPREPREPREPQRDLEELLGGRVLGWVGGIAVVLAAVFFLVMAVRNGWIGETARVLLAFAASLALAAAGVWLHERRGRLQAARAAVAAGLAALYASDTAATALYHLVSPVAGLVIAGVVGGAALAAALRWESQELAGIGIVGSLLAPVLVHAGVHASSLIFMTIALAAAIGVAVERRWSWLPAVAYVVSVPQAAAWLNAEHLGHLTGTLAVAVAFWLLYAVAAIGHDLRTPDEGFRVGSASLLFVNASLTSAGGWWLIDDAGHHTGATIWLFALGAAHLAIAAVVRGDLRVLVGGVAAALAGVGVALALDGPALVAAWTAEAMLLAWVSRRTDERRPLAAAGVFVALAAAHVLAFELPPTALAYGIASVPQAVVGVGLVLAALLAGARLHPVLARPLQWTAAAVDVYLGSTLVVDVAGAHAGAATQTSQLALSGFWALLGFVSLVAGLQRRRRALRLGGLALLALAVGKVFIVDLAALESIWRVGSFLGLGLLLLAGAFAYQRVLRPAER